MPNFDVFEFKGIKGESRDTYNHDATPYDSEIPKEFRVEEPGPDPFDVQVGMNWAQDLIAWGFDDIA